MALQVKLLRSSFEAVAPDAERLADVFYDTLFERYPAVKPLFAETDMPKQKMKLIQSIGLVVHNLEKPDVLGTALHKLGAQHVDYGAEDAHYAAVGECLLHALSVVAGDLWNDELEQAWAHAHQAVADGMIEGARQARAERTGTDG